MFGDTAVQAVLLVTHNMLHSKQVENPWMDRFNLPSRDDDDNEEEKKDSRPAL